MTNYALPNHTKIRSVVFRMASQNAITQSPFTYKQQVLSHPGRRWEVDVSLPPMRHANARQWLAWFGRLDGAVNTFTLGDPMGCSPRGVGGGSPLVAGAGQTGASLDVDGAPISTTGWLLEGDYIQIGTGGDARLYIVTGDVHTDGAGAATLNLWPEVKSAPDDNAAIVIDNAVGAFRLASNVSTWSLDSMAVYGIQFSGVGVV